MWGGVGWGAACAKTARMWRGWGELRWVGLTVRHNSTKSQKAAATSFCARVNQDYSLGGNTLSSAGMNTLPCPRQFETNSEQVGDRSTVGGKARSKVLLRVITTAGLR